MHVSAGTVLADPSALDTEVLAPARGRTTELITVLACALAITLGQTLLAAALSGRLDPLQAYQALYQWDSVWYGRLAEEGYAERLPERQADMARVGFFPGYPLSSHLVGRLTGLPAPLALPLAAQLAAWGFWTYVLLFLRRWQASGALTRAAVLAIVVYPTAFFLVAGYSESLFMAALLGCLYWSAKPGRTAWHLALAHGVVMTATRIVGLPLAGLPFALALVELARPGSSAGVKRFLPLVRTGLLGALASLGGLLFFAWCQQRYGRWDAYMYSQRVGWGVVPDYLALLRLQTYIPTGPPWVRTGLNADWLSRVCVPLTVLLFAVLVAVERRLARTDGGMGWRQRWAFYLGAGVMFYIAVAGTAGNHLISMLRYTFSAHALLVLAVVHLLAQHGTPRWLVRAFAVTAPLLACVEALLLGQFTHGLWVG